MNRRLEVPDEYPASLQIVEGPIPSPPPLGVVVKTSYAGICHTDVHCWKNSFKLGEGQRLTMTDTVGPHFKFPIVMGHEISGVVYALGSDYKGDVKVGDRVVLYPWIGCNQCGFCRVEDYATCDKVLSLCNGMGGLDGGYQQYVVGPDANFAVKVSDDTELDTACMFGCSTLTSYTAVQCIQSTVEKFCKMNGSANVLIVGAGGLGLWAVSLCKALLPPTTKVYVADIDESKFGPAKDVGADGFVLWDLQSSEDVLIARANEVIGGVNASIDLVGLGTTVMRTFKCTTKGAKMCVIGLAGGLADIPTVNLVCETKCIEGALVGHLRQTKELAALYSSKKVKCIPKTLIPPERAEESLNLMIQGKLLGRHIIDFTGN